MRAMDTATAASTGNYALNPSPTAGYGPRSRQQLAPDLMPDAAAWLPGPAGETAARGGGAILPVAWSGMGHLWDSLAHGVEHDPRVVVCQALRLPDLPQQIGR